MRQRSVARNTRNWPNDSRGYKFTYYASLTSSNQTHMKIERSGIIKSELKGDTELDVVGMMFAMFQETAVD